MKKSNIKSIIGFLALAVFLNYVLFVPSIAYADEEIASISKGERAPFSGTIFNIQASARVLAELETSKEACKIECDRETEKKIADLQLRYNILKASNDALTLKYDETLKIKNSQIDFLEDKIKKPPISKEVMFVLGVVAGVGITMSSAYALGQISNIQ